jgi:predicted O-linked N-acetylglucosamine transferase (SPINDLY family)
MTTAEAHFLAGLQEHKQGRSAAAESHYRAALAVDPDHFTALQHLGAILADRGEAAAAELFAHAARLKPSDPVIFYQLATALAGLERYDEALAAFDAAIALKNDIPRLHAGRGSVLHSLKRYDEAVAAYGAALQLRPNDALTHANQAAALQLAGRVDAALAAINRSLALKADDPKSLVIRALARIDLGDIAPGIADFEYALRLQPDNLELLQQFASALLKSGNPVRAIDVYSELLRRDPDNVDAYVGRAAVRYLVALHQDAVADCDAALARNPASAAALYNRANALAALKREDEALADIAATLALEPDLGQAYATRFSILAARCDFAERDQTAAELVRVAEAGQPIYPFVLLYTKDDPALHRAAASLAAGSATRPRPPLKAHARLRIGYMSADWRNHVVAHQMIEVLERHDRSQFEIVGISLSPGDGTPFRERVVKAFDRFVESGDCSDTDLAKRIAGLDLDIVVDCTGHTDRSRTRALKARPAPLAVGYLGYAGTLGADYIDYLIADGAVIGPDDDGFYAEKVVRLPFWFMPRDTTVRPAPAPSRAEAGLPDTGLVFASFSNAYKIDAGLFAVWMRLLTAVPDSVLWLGLADEIARANLRAEAVRRGVDPARLRFAPKVASREAHLGRLKLIDVALDTRGYGGHATASDLLWAGVPMVTLSGRSFPARVGGAMLRYAGLDDLVAGDLAAYEQVALALAADGERRAAIRTHIAAIHDRFFDMTRFARGLEAAYRTMIETLRQGRPPEAFAVADPS